MSAENITVHDFIVAETNATRNASDKPEFRRLMGELENLPKVKERLALELLDLGGRTLGEQNMPQTPLIYGLAFQSSVSATELPQYLDKVEKITLKAFRLAGQRHGNRFSMALSLSLSALHKLDAQRFAVVRDALKNDIANPSSDPRSEILKRFTERRKSRYSNSGN